MKLLLPLLVMAGAALAANPEPHLPPSDEACKMAAPRTGKLAFGPGEALEYDLDALGAKAGTLRVRTLRVNEAGELPIEATVETNTFFSKVRRVHGVGTSYLAPASLHAQRYTEDATENELHRTVEAHFDPAAHAVRSTFQVADKAGRRDFHLGVPPALDNVGAIYFMRQMELKTGEPLCFDVFALRRLWRMSGKVVGREHVSLGVGEFEAWHLQGEAVRLDDATQHREVHLWVSDDARRLPLVAVGSIDLGAVRATLIGFERPMDKGAKRRAHKQDAPF